MAEDLIGLSSGELMLDAFERLVLLSGDTVDQSIVNIEFSDADGHRQTRTLSLFDAIALARALEPVRKAAQEKGWVQAG